MMANIDLLTYLVTFRRRPGRLMYIQFTSCVYGVVLSLQIFSHVSHPVGRYFFSKSTLEKQTRLSYHRKWFTLTTTLQSPYGQLYIKASNKDILANSFDVLLSLLLTLKRYYSSC